MPLIILAVLAIVAGFYHPPFNGWFGEWLTGEAWGDHTSVLVIILSNVVAITGLFGSVRLIYYKKSIPCTIGFPARLPGCIQLVISKSIISMKFITSMIVNPQSDRSCAAIDRPVHCRRCGQR